MKIDKKRLIIFVLAVVLVITSFCLIKNNQNKKFDELDNQIKTLRVENKDLTTKISSLEQTIQTEQSQKATLLTQLRAAEEDLHDNGSRLEKEHDNILIEAHKMYEAGQVTSAKDALINLDTSYLTPLQLYIYQQIVK